MPYAIDSMLVSCCECVCVDRVWSIRIGRRVNVIKWQRCSISASKNIRQQRQRPALFLLLSFSLSPIQPPIHSIFLLFHTAWVSSRHREHRTCLCWAERNKSTIIDMALFSSFQWRIYCLFSIHFFFLDYSHSIKSLIDTHAWWFFSLSNMCASAVY